MAACTRFGEITSITIEATDEYYGLTKFDAAPMDRTFITYAGPWAEARAQWRKSTLDVTDGDGHTFDDYLDRASNRNRDGDLEALSQFAVNHPATATEQLERARHWPSELERLWPVIQAVAERLLTNTEVTTEIVCDLIRPLGYRGLYG